MNFFRIVGTSEAETSVSGKAECLLAIGEDKKVSFLESPSFSFNLNQRNYLKKHNNAFKFLEHVSNIIISHNECLVKNSKMVS